MGQLGIVEGGDEKEAEAETAAAVSVAVGDDFEAFEHGDDVFTGDALAGYFSVSGFVVFG